MTLRKWMLLDDGSLLTVLLINMFLPIATFGFWARSASGHWWIVVLSTIATAAVLLVLTRHMIGFWRAPASRAGGWSVGPYLALGLLLGFSGLGRLVEEERLHLRLFGALALVLALQFLALAVRDMLRMRSRRITNSVFAD